MREVAAHAVAARQDLRRGQPRIARAHAILDALGHPIADGLSAEEPVVDVAEVLPGKVEQLVAVYVAARHDVAQKLRRQRVHGHDPLAVAVRLGERRHPHDRIMTQEVFSSVQQEPLRKIAVHIFELAGMQPRLEVQAFLANHLRWGQTWANQHQGGRLGRRAVHELAADSHGERQRRKVFMRQASESPASVLSALGAAPRQALPGQKRPGALPCGQKSTRRSCVSAACALSHEVAWCYERSQEQAPATRCTRLYSPQPCEATMQELNAHANQAIQDMSQRYGVSTDAVRTLLFAVQAGGGTMAQFYHPELGGGGQWMQGGMTMVGDMFNHGLQATVSNLCSELSSLLASQPLFVQKSTGSGMQGFATQGNAWWPAELGAPSSSGGQDNVRYAYFPQARRLLIERGGQVSTYDTLDHNIGGVQQQQGGPSGSLSFSSQYGTFTVESLPLVSPHSQVDQVSNTSFSGSPSNNQPIQSEPTYVQASAPAASSPAPQTLSHAAPSSPSMAASGANPQSQQDILGAIERLGDLHQRGLLSEEEFRTKKSELLARL